MKKKDIKELMMEKQDDRPEITGWLRSKEYTKGYNQAVKENNAKVRKLLSK